MPTNADLVRVLEGLPECKLSLLDIARSCATPLGELDMDKLVVASEDIDMAIKEARAYASATQALIQRVRNTLCNKTSLVR